MSDNAPRWRDKPDPPGVYICWNPTTADKWGRPIWLAIDTEKNPPLNINPEARMFGPIPFDVDLLPKG